MALFGLGKKKGESKGKESCNCGGQCAQNDTKSARFLVLGACCQKSADTFTNVKQAVSEMGFGDEVINVGEMTEIAKYGVMQTPALVIDGKVVSYGKLLRVEDVKKLIEKEEKKDEEK